MRFQWRLRGRSLKVKLVTLKIMLGSAGI